MEGRNMRTGCVDDCLVGYKIEGYEKVALGN